MVRKILATKDIVMIIEGVTYDALLIPREKMVDMDYSNHPEDDPTNKEDNPRSTE